MFDELYFELFFSAKYTTIFGEFFSFSPICRTFSLTFSATNKSPLTFRNLIFFFQMFTNSVASDDNTQKLRNNLKHVYNQSENRKYNLILVHINNIWRLFLRVPSRAVFRFSGHASVIYGVCKVSHKIPRPPTLSLSSYTVAWIMSSLNVSIYSYPNV